MIDWQQFGLKRNPYDTLPLTDGGELPIEAAFVGRRRERELLSSIFASEHHACVAVCGDVGVGKTSLANMQKITWKHNRKKPLFSFRREIEANIAVLTKREFILEIIGSVLRELSLVDPKLFHHPTLKKLNSLVDTSYDLSVSISGGISIAGFGGNIGISKHRERPQQISMSSLESHLQELLSFIKKNKIARKQYDGLIIHMNNFDVAIEQDKPRVINFFQEIRDLLQTPNLYFLFLGPRNFFTEIISAEPRVKSMFNLTNIVLEPLRKEEIIHAFNERMKLLKSDNIRQFIPPVSDEVVSFLYDFHHGDIRSIMASVSHVLSLYPPIAPKTLDLTVAMYLFGQWQWEELGRTMNITNEQKEILIYIAQSEQHANQKTIAQIFKKAQANISGYYFRPLKESNVIEIKKKEGREKYWGITKEFEPLETYIKSLRVEKKLLK